MMMARAIAHYAQMGKRKKCARAHTHKKVKVTHMLLDRGDGGKRDPGHETLALALVNK